MTVSTTRIIKFLFYVVIAACSLSALHEQWTTERVSWNQMQNIITASSDYDLQFKVDLNTNKVNLVLLRTAVESHSAIVDWKRYSAVVPSISAFEEKVSHISKKSLQSYLFRSRIPNISVLYEAEKNSFWTLSNIIFAFVMIDLFSAITEKMVGKSPGKIFELTPGKNQTTFSQVAGLAEVKQEVREYVDFLKNPAEYNKIGAKIPSGLLLSGPPGTGKTMLAKATAFEAGVPFYSISGSEFMEMFVGVGPSRVRELFKKARKTAPAIVFIDEIESIGRKRSKSSSGGDTERESTLNQLLVEMDGFNSANALKPVVVFAATNRPDILDPALTRSGRFDRKIDVPLPDLSGREMIASIYLKNLQLVDDIGTAAKELAKQSAGLSGADIANICNEGALIAVRAGRKTISLTDLCAGVTRIIAGVEKKSSVMTAKEKRLLAYHEAGHAVIGWKLPGADAVNKVSIIPRTKGALGFTQFNPKDVVFHSKEDLFDRMCTLLAGKASEMFFLKSITSGAQDDLEKVTTIAYVQVQKYGMNEKVGLMSFEDKSHFSDSTAQLIDEQARILIDTAYSTTLKLVESYKDNIESVANLLSENEVITGEDLLKILGPKTVHN